jgi:hypothetical protein
MSKKIKQTPADDYFKDYLKDKKYPDNSSIVIVENNENSLDDDRSTSDWLKKRGAGSNSDFIDRTYDLNTEQGRKGAELSQVLSFRRFLFWVQSVWVIVVIPLWLIIVLSLPFFGIQVYDAQPGMYQLLFAALMTNVFGMYLIIAKYLFPSVKDSSTSDKDSKK